MVIIVQINTRAFVQTLALSTIKRKRDCLHFSTVAAYSFSSEDVNVSDLILGHPLFQKKLEKTNDGFHLKY